MLALTMTPGKEIYIDGGRIRIKLIRVQGTKVSLGFDAEAEIVIDRKEIHERRHGVSQEPPVLKIPGGRHGAK